MKKLFIDIPALMESNVNSADIQCEYMFHQKNNGAFSLLEVAEFSAYCRQCKEAFCIEACPKEALEHQENGMIKRYNMRCVGCKSCILACPFGTIFPEVINYVTSKCDYCLNQLEQNANYIPACAKTAPANSFVMKEVVEDHKQNIFFVGNHLAVKTPNWLKREGRL
ncbi:MAG: 4Fe-4S binding protein [Ignavibacteriaceae bacterium]|nr:4Fe-4S binding protein [Ignavibacteriaceae bacterium]